MGGLGLLPLLAALGIPASLGARRFARPSAALVPAMNGRGPCALSQVRRP